MPYVLIGERQSPLAAARGWSWRDGHVCAGTLARALTQAGIDPSTVLMLNLWAEPGLGRPRDAPRLEPVRHLHGHGYTVIALGRLVERELRRAAIPHRFMVHPAARGAIRKRERYAAHVRAVLTGSRPDEPDSREER